MVVVLDIGGVLMKLGGMETLLRWTGMTPSELKSRWLSAECVIGFETGRISFDDFAPAAIEEFSLPVDAGQLAAEMRGWMTEPYDGAANLIASLRERHALACMCNINAVQWPHVRRALDVDRAFPRRFVSFEVGMAKPSPGFYALVASQMEAEPSEIHFFDDTRENVEAALRCGWSASCVRGTAELRAALLRDGLI